MNYRSGCDKVSVFIATSQGAQPPNEVASDADAQSADLPVNANKNQAEGIKNDAQEELEDMDMNLRLLKRLRLPFSKKMHGSHSLRRRNI